MKISAIALVGKNWELGLNNDLIWKLPEDMRHFRKTTEHHAIIMGRKTYESIGHPLPKRRNYVMTSSGCVFTGDMNWVSSLDAALENACRTMQSHAFIIGGGQVYREALERSLPHEIILTRVNEQADDADTFFPNMDRVTNYTETAIHPLVEGLADIHIYTRNDLL